MMKYGRRPQYFGIWKTTSNLWKMEDDLNFFGKLRDDLNFLGKWKTTSIFVYGTGRQPKFFKATGRQPQCFSQMEDDLNFILN